MVRGPRRASDLSGTFAPDLFQVSGWQGGGHSAWGITSRALQLGRDIHCQLAGGVPDIPLRFAGCHTGRPYRPLMGIVVATPPCVALARLLHSHGPMAHLVPS